VIWLRKGVVLWAFDMRTAGAKAMPVIKGIPEGVRTRIQRPGDATPGVMGSHAELAIVLAKPPTLAAAIVKGDDWELAYAEPEDKKKLETLVKEARTKAKVVDPAFLTTLAGRAPRAAAPRAQFSDRSRVAMPKGMPKCEDATICGQSAPFGRYQLVFVEHSCGDFCHQSCLLHDPASKKWAALPSTTKWMAGSEAKAAVPCTGYRLDKGSAHFLTDEVVCAVGGACTPVGGTPLGWIDPGAVFVRD
jgi:hypothetical protein